MFAIAIDGPAGAGKSSVAKAAARALGFIYVDTGARAAAFPTLLLPPPAGPSIAIANKMLILAFYRFDPAA